MKYVKYVAAGILIGFILLLYVDGCKKDKIISEKDVRIAQLDSILTVFKEHGDTTYVYSKGKDSIITRHIPVHDSIAIKTGIFLDTTIIKGQHSVHVIIDSLLTQILLNCKDSVKESYRVDTLKIEIPKLIPVTLPPLSAEVEWYNTMPAGVVYGVSAVLVILKLKILGI